MSELTDSTIPPWYKQFWPWFLIFLPASAVVAGITTVIIATTHRDHMVVDNYYKEGLAINRVITQQQQAAGLGLRAHASYNQQTGKLRIALQSDTVQNLTELNLSLIHTTQASHDQKVVLKRDESGAFSTIIKNITAGRWNLVLEPGDGQWRLDAKIVYPANDWVFKPDV